MTVSLRNARFFALVMVLTIASTHAWSATAYYVSTAGTDSNSGTSPSLAWKTVSKVNNMLPLLKPGDSVLFQRGGVWRDAFIECLNDVRVSSGMTTASKPPICSGSSSAPLTIGSYGLASLAKPVIDGADPLVLEWSSIGGSTYTASFTGDAPSKLFVDSAVTQSTQLLPVPNYVGSYSASATYSYLDAVLSGGSLYVYGAMSPASGTAVTDLTSWANLTNTVAGNTSQTFLPSNTGVSNVLATPGSWYVSGSTLYVHLLDGSDPSLHNFEGTRRSYGVLLEGTNYVTVTGLAVEHVRESGIAQITFPSDRNSYFAGEYNKIIGNDVWNYGNIVLDHAALQEHASWVQAGILIRCNGQYSPHLLRGNLISQNRVGTMDAYFALRGGATQYQAGIVAVGIDGGGAANHIVISNNYISTTNSAGIIYDTIGVYQSVGMPLNNGGRVTGNELTNNQGNILFTATRGGMEDHNIIHHSYGQGVQSGGGSLSTTSLPQTHAFDLIYHLGKGANGMMFNGFDCNSTTPAAGIYWLNNTVYDTNSAAITFEGTGNVGCTSPHVHNNIFDQSGLRFPAFDMVNPSYLLFFVHGIGDNHPDFSNNLWVAGANRMPYHSTALSYAWSTFSQAWPDRYSGNVASAGFVNPDAGDFHLLSSSPAIGAGISGTTSGALQ